MARKCKVGLDYFSHDVDILQDKRIKLIKAKHGLLGYAIYLRLLEEIYRENGYYLQIDEDFNILFSDDNNIEIDVYKLILNDCINKGLFNEKLYKKYSILTSKRIQEDYCHATERRKEIEFIREYLLVDLKKEYKQEKINVSIIKINDYINKQNENISTHSIVEYSIVEKSIEKNNILYATKFKEFWEAYPKRNGKKIGKAKTFKLFKQINKDEIDSVIAGTKRYSYQNTAIKDPERFLKHQVWRECNKYSGDILEKAKTIYSEYPKKYGGIIAINSICEALKKVEYNELLSRVKQFSQKIRMSEQQEIYYPSAKSWFDREMWLDMESDEQKKEDNF